MLIAMAKVLRLIHLGLLLRDLLKEGRHRRLPLPRTVLWVEGKLGRVEVPALPRSSCAFVAFVGLFQVLGVRFFGNQVLAVAVLLT